MWRKIIQPVLTGLLVTGCSFTPSQLNSNPARYDERIVVVRGIVTLTPETHVLCESRALAGDVHEGWRGPENRGFEVGKYEMRCVTIANPELLYRNLSTVNAKTLTFQGRFIGNYQVGKSADLGAGPLRTAIVIDNRALARRYPRLLPQE
jgi:hypothetical protein